MLVEPILADLPFSSGDPVIAFVNGLGGTPLIELYVMYNEVNKILSGHGVTVARSLVGLLHHLARDGRLLGHPAQGRRRAAVALGRSRQDTGTEVGDLTDELTTRPRRPSTPGYGASPRSSPRTGTTSPSWTPRSATPTTAPTWTGG